MKPSLIPNQFLATHRYQFDGSHPNRNECALCAMAMLLDQAGQLSGNGLELQPVELGKFLDRIPFRYPRFPAWFPGPGGATHPIGVYAGLRDYIRQAKLPWRAFLAYRRNEVDLENSLTRSFPTLIYGVGSTGIPHVVVPVRKVEGGWLILDPGYPTDRNPMKWTTKDLGEWWKNYSVIYPRGTMISLRPWK